MEDSSDDKPTTRITPEIIELYSETVNVDQLTIWEGHPVDYDVGAATMFDKSFGKTDVVYTYGDEVLLGKAQVEAEKIDPKDDGTTRRLDLEALGWPREKAEGLALGKLTQYRTAVWDDSATLEAAIRLHEYDQELARNAGWDGDTIDELAELVGDDDPLTEYTNTIQLPIYEPKRDKPPTMRMMMNREFADELIQEIESAEGLTSDERALLTAAAERHVIFQFDELAEFYCHASPTVQALMERSAMIVVDVDSSIENGYIKMVETIAELSSEAL